MAELNFTADEIQSTKNMITSRAAASAWDADDADEKYPSVAAVKQAIAASAGAAVCDAANTVGSVVITSTNTNPGNALGGEWSLIDKEFINRSANIAPLWSGTQATASGSISWAGHSICLKMWLSTDQYPISPGNIIGTIDLAAAGVTSFSFSDEGGVAFAVNSTGNSSISYVIKYSLNGGGQLYLDRIYGESVAAFSSSTIHIQTIIPMSASDMLDTACDKFYWKRTA